LGPSLDENQMAIHIVLSLVCLAFAGPNRPSAALGAVTFKGASDASAAVVIDRDLMAVADDEDNVLRLYAVNGGEAKTTFDMTAFLQLDTHFPEVDIEAAARIGDRIYWITSHGRNKDGKPRPNRYRFFATQIQKTDTGVSLKPVGRPCKTLLSQLLDAQSLQGLGLQEAAGIDLSDIGTRMKDRKKLAPKDEGLNIEGLCVSADGRTLLIGLRNPIPKGRALVIPIENPAAVVEMGQPASLGRPLLWNLGGWGIRDMVYVGDLQTCLIIAGPHNEEKRFALYRWSGKIEEPPVQVRSDLGRDYPDFTPEAIVGFGSEAKLLILSDDGTREVEVAGPQECMPGEFLGGRCPNKSLLDPHRKTFRGLWLSTQGSTLPQEP
jgi:hypothetical protein